MKNTFGMCSSFAYVWIRFTSAHQIIQKTVIHPKIQDEATLV